MFKINFFTIIITIYYLIINNLAYARAIRVDSCTIPFDFTIGSVCVLGTLSLWIIIPVISAIVFGGFNVIVQIIKNIFRR
jgi:hypothetical protein